MKDDGREGTAHRSPLKVAEQVLLPLEVAGAAGLHSGVHQTLSPCHAVKEELLREKWDPGPGGGSEDGELLEERLRPKPPAASLHLLGPLTACGPSHFCPPLR